ncbi:hypothetical protein BGX38DRAFT_1201115 [Terfezia claveryi]|nr:hypothetical protein BGX38DRAFT_1201115 [Terfezia claveryi]
MRFDLTSYVSLEELAPIEAHMSEPIGSPVKVDEGPAVEGDVVIPIQQPTGDNRSFVSDANKKVLPVDEPLEAADLRRQMIDYNLHNFGYIVAEIDLDNEDKENKE